MSKGYKNIILFYFILDFSLGQLYYMVKTANTKAITVSINILMIHFLPMIAPQDFISQIKCTVAGDTAA